MTDNTQAPSTLFPDGGPQASTAQETLPSTLFPNTKNSGSLSGPYADVYFSHGIPSFSDVGSVMSHIGQGASEAWGANINSLPKIADQALTKAGLYNDHTKNEQSYFKTLNEELVRPVINTVLPLGAGLLGGLQGAFQGVGEALQTKAKQSNEAFGSTLNPLSATLGEAGEYIGSIPERVPDIPILESATRSIPEVTAEARSKAVIGEGEQGFFNTKPVSEENLQARQDAAKQAGQPTPPEPEPPQMDIHSVVRQMDPVLFQEVDRLNGIKSNFKDSMAYAQSQDIADAEKELTAAQAAGSTDRVDNLNSLLADLKSGVIGPKAQIAQKGYLDADAKLRDLIPEVSSVYNHAQEIMMTPEEIAEDPKLAQTRLQQLNDKIETDGLSKEEWNEYNQLNQSQEQKVSTEVKKPVSSKMVEPSTVNSGTSEGGLKTLSSEAGPSKTAKSAKDINEAAIDKGMSKGFKNLAEFTSTTEEYQKTGVKNLLQGDYDNATAIALGEKSAPSDLLPGMVFDAVKTQAKADGDLDLLMKLARSPLASQSSKLGQALGMVDRFDETNPADLIKHIEDARKKSVGEQATRTITKDTQDFEQKKDTQMAIKSAWSEWLNSVPECGE